MTTADVDQMWGFQLSELVLMDCPCCHTTLADHSLTEAMRCGQEAAKAEIRGEPHPYTVDVYLVGAEPYPCTICGQQRQAPIHLHGSAEKQVKPNDR